jgi:hypothetical protein
VDLVLEQAKVELCRHCTITSVVGMHLDTRVVVRLQPGRSCWISGGHIEIYERVERLTGPDRLVHVRTYRFACLRRASAKVVYVPRYPEVINTSAHSVGAEK